MVPLLRHFARSVHMLQGGRGMSHRNMFESLESRQLMSAFTVTNVNDAGAGSLRDAIAQANSNVGADTIEFATNLGPKITLSSQLDISGDLTINGPGANKLAIDGNSLTRVLNFTGSNGTSYLNNITVSNGFATIGAGIELTGGSLTILSSAITGNQATDSGGGIHAAPGTNLTVIQSLIANNQATKNAAGIWAQSSFGIWNSTISDNIAQKFGGGIKTEIGGVIYNCTIAGNYAGGSAGSGIWVTNGWPIVFKSTVFAGNYRGFHVSVDSGLLDNLQCTNNLFENSNGSGGIVAGNGNIFTTNAQLGPLQDNGGPTLSRALGASSVGINAGNNFGQLSTDQRGTGYYRTRNTVITSNQIDIGALQTQPGKFVVKNANDSGADSLREAANKANASAGYDIISFDAAAFATKQTIKLTSAITLSDEVAINGPGADKAVVSGQHNVQVFRFTQIDAFNALNAITVTAGNNTVFNNGEGGGITMYYNNLAMNGIVITDCDGYYGGAIHANNARGFTLDNSTISGNRSQYFGGGIYFPGTSATGTLAGIITNSTIADNSSARGGGIYVGANRSFQILKSTISGNSATERGGGLNLEGALANVISCTISGNSAGTGATGGGIYAKYDTFNKVGLVKVFNSTIAGNSAPAGAGGGLRIDDTSGFGVAQSYSSIYANNTGGAIVGRFNSSNNGEYNSNNLVTDSGFAGGLDGSLNGNIIIGNALLGTFGDYGGPTKTIPILAGSKAINAGLIRPEVATIIGDSDQRGGTNKRTIGSTVDIGAFEYNAKPTIFSLVASGTTFNRGQTVTLTANGVADADGSIVRVRFFLDANKNGTNDNGELLGADPDPTGGYTFDYTLPTNVAAGSLSFLAIAIDDASQASDPAVASVTLNNTLPTLDSLAVSASTFTRYSTFFLQANSAADPDGTIVRADFFRDRNNSGVIDSGDDYLGSDTDSTGGWTWTIDTTSVATHPPDGLNKFLARAVDNDGAFSPERAASATFNSNYSLPTLGWLTSTRSTINQGESITLVAGDPRDTYGYVTRVDFYWHNYNNRTGNLDFIGSDSNGADGYSITFDSTGAPPLGTTFYAAATDDQGGVGAYATFNVNITQIAASGLPAGTADNKDTHRVVYVNAAGHILVYQQGWTYQDLQEKTGAPNATGDAITWVDPKDNLTYVSAPSAAGLLLFNRAASGTWSVRNLTTEYTAPNTPVRNLTQFTSIGKIVVIAGITSDGKIAAFQQTLASSPVGKPAFKFVDISAQVTANGGTTPSLNNLISYVPTWDAWHLAGIDQNGHVQSIWLYLPDGVTTTWRVVDLSVQTGAPAFTGQLAVNLTSWGGINLTGLDTSGNVLTTWWVPGNNWATSNLTAAYSGAPLSGGKISGYTTPWGGLNYVGLAADGTVTVYWWAPGRDNWSVNPLLPSTTDTATRPAGTLTSSSSAKGTLNVYGTTANNHVVRMWWNPSGVNAWTTEDLTALAVKQ